MRTLLALMAGGVGLSLMASCALARRQNPINDLLVSWLGPPRTELVEAYESSPAESPDFDHRVWDALVNQHVNSAGGVDYDGFAATQDQLGVYLASLGQADFAALSRDGKLAFLINAYNAFTIQLILDNPDVLSIRDIPSHERWKAKRWVLAGETLSLDTLEHDRIRPRFREPRVHFALVCAAVSCPKLRNEAYTAAELEHQLQDQATYTHQQPQWFRYAPRSSIVELTPLYSWYRGDFEQLDGNVLDAAASYAPELAFDLALGHRPSISWLKYDWSLNSKTNLPNATGLP